MTKNRKHLAALAVLAFFLSARPLAIAEELTGRQVMEKKEQLNKGRDEFNNMSMKLINNRGQERNRKIEYYRKSDKNDSDKILMRFLEPADVKGVGLLTVEQIDRDDDQWLYLPALKKVSRISSGDQTDSFMGTDFTYEDIRSEKLDKHQYTIIGSEPIDGHDCYLIEAVPATDTQKEESGYGRREIWVRKDIFLAVQTKYYDRQNRLVKVKILKDIIEVAPGIHRPNFMEMKDLKADRTTQLIFDNRRINDGIEDRIFTQRELKRG